MSQITSPEGFGEDRRPSGTEQLGEPYKGRRVGLGLRRDGTHMEGRGENTEGNTWLCGYSWEAPGPDEWAGGEEEER